VEELSVNISIADRPYRLSIKRSDEQAVREAAKIINDRIKDYADAYAYQDKQDLLAMAALQYTVAAVQFQQEVNYRDNHLEQKLTEIDSVLTTHLVQAQ
jgi:cell division protein ZapA (FtsZ GTPase activity inhibitor)